MKNVFVIALFLFSLLACQSETAKQNQSSETKAAAPAMSEPKAEVKDDTAKQHLTYACPMHPEVVSDKAGDKCSKCGMELVLQGKH